MKRLWLYLWGYAILTFPTSQKAAVYSAFLQRGLGIYGQGDNGDATCITVLARDLLRLPKDLPCTLLRRGGLGLLVRRLFRRPGLILGTLLGILIFTLSSLTVWRVEVIGNEELTSLEIEEAVAEAGLGVGAFTPTVDTAAVRTRVLEAEPTLSFVSIYVRGTTVLVEVREAAPYVPPSEDEGLFNLVATSDAIVESVTAKVGRAAVTKGMTVRQGDLLISGIYRTASGVVSASAEGEVRGRVRQTVELSQPFYETVKEYGKRQKASFSMNFFGREIKLFKSGGKSEGEYDIIKRKEQLTLFGVIRLPITLSWEYALPYEERRVTLTEEEAVRAAFVRMRGLLAAQLAGAEVLAESFTGEFTDSGFHIRCDVDCVIDIAAPLAYQSDLSGG